jgi:hypothetical protein
MTERYELARSLGDPEYVLVVRPEGWDRLPFEIRLLRPWYGSELCEAANLTSPQRADILKQGYCVARAAEFTRLGQRSTKERRVVEPAAFKSSALMRS